MNIRLNAPKILKKSPITLLLPAIPKECFKIVMPFLSSHFNITTTLGESSKGSFFRSQDERTKFAMSF